MTPECEIADHGVESGGSATQQPRWNGVEHLSATPRARPGTGHSLTVWCVEEARTELRRAFAALDLPAEWREWDRASPDAPAHARQYGSPTVLVNGKDVAGDGTEADANCCRVYAVADRGLRGAPSAEVIKAALLGE